MTTFHSYFRFATTFVLWLGLALAGGGASVRSDGKTGNSNGMQAAPAQSVADETGSGALAKKRNKCETVPISIDLTMNGATPFIGRTTRKSNQTPTNEDTGADYNVNPWFGRGGANALVGQVVPVAFGKVISRQWLITFRGNPYNATWGRNVYERKAFPSKLRPNGDLGNPGYLTSGSHIDTDLENDYISGNKVYMYDQPGGPLCNRPARVVEVWADSANVSPPVRLTRWFYVDLVTGDAYEINPPWELPPPVISSGYGAGSSPI